jgi:integrase
MMATKRRGHGEGSIYKRKDGRWTASISLGDGKRKSFYGKTRKEVKEKLDAALLDQKKGVNPEGTQKLGDYLRYWLDNVHKHVIGISTYVDYEIIIRVHLIPGLGNLRLSELTTQRVQTFFNSLLKKGLSTSRVHSIDAVLSRAIEDAVVAGILPFNVCKGIKLPPVENEERIPLTTTQAKIFLDAARKHRLFALFTVATILGLRRGETVALMWSDIDLEQGILHVQRTASRLPKRGIVVRKPKTKKSNRLIKMPSFIMNILKEHKVQQEQDRENAGDIWLNQNLVFCNTFGGYIEPDYLLRILRKILLKAKLPDVTFHDLRHSARSIMKALGVNDKVAQEVLGHASYETDQVYIHLLKEMVDDATQKLDDTFGNS